MIDRLISRMNGGAEDKPGLGAPRIGRAFVILRDAVPRRRYALKKATEPMMRADYTSEDAVWMKRCRELAAKAAERGNTAVGSVIILNGEVLAEALEEVPAGPDPFAHAELTAVREALQSEKRWLLAEATLYSTAEPCFMCSYAIRNAAIGRVVINRPTPGVGGVTSVYPILVAADVQGWGSPPVLIWEPAPGE